MDPNDVDAEIGHVAPLGQDTIPDANQSHYCHSCETPFTGVYCTACGQKNDDYRRSLFSLTKEFIGSITAIESRIWRTWGALLFRPGKVAREYANGRRTHWSSPVRVYIAMSILLFGFLSVTQIQLISLDIDARPLDGITKPIDELTAKDVRLAPKLHFLETKKKINQRNASRNFDLIALRLADQSVVNFDFDSEQVKEKMDESTRSAVEQGWLSPENLEKAKKAVDDYDAERDIAAEDKDSPSSSDNGNMKLTLSNINGKKYELPSVSSIIVAIIQNPETINGAFFKYLPRIMFIMMPFTMLIGALFIRGRENALLYDHLVHAAYIHAVTFFLLLLGIILSFIITGSTVSKFLFVALLIYLPLSLKRMFGRSWPKTIFTSYGVGFIYAFNITLIMTGLLGFQIVNTLIDMGTPLAP